MKPFIKPRPATPPQPEPAAQRSNVSLNELTIFALASAMSDPAERAAYLDRTCGADEDLRQRLEARLSAVPTVPVPQPVATKPPAAPAPRVESAYLERQANDKDSPALALVPVSAMQFPALPPQLQRQVTFAWGSATLMALAVGALAVVFYFEKDARVRAETATREAQVTAAQSQREREQSDAKAQEAKNEAQRIAEARAKAEKERDDATAKATAAAQETERLRAEAEKQKAEVDKLRASGDQNAKAEKEQYLSAQRTATIALADSLASLATLQLAAKAYNEAEANARQCLELRTGNGIDGWPVVEARTLLGEASLQRNADADAERELTTAGAAIEALGTPTNDTDRARLAAASKRIVLFFNATGRKKEATDWKRRLDAVAKPALLPAQ